MAEAIAAIGLAASVIQIADFSRRFLRRLKEYREKTNTLPSQFEDIDIQLPYIICVLEVLELRIQQDGYDAKFSRTLRPILEASRMKIERLDTIFSNLSLSSCSSSWERKRRAIRSLQCDRDVKRCIESLKDHTRLLLFCGMISTEAQFSDQSLSEIQRQAHSSDALSEASSEQSDLVTISHGPREDLLAKWTKPIDFQNCTCSRLATIQQSNDWPLWRSRFVSQVLSMHHASCPLFMERNNLRRLSFHI